MLSWASFSPNDSNPASPVDFASWIIHLVFLVFFSPLPHPPTAARATISCHLDHCGSLLTVLPAAIDFRAP